MMADTTQRCSVNPVSKPPVNRKNIHQTSSKEHYTKHLGKKQSLPSPSSFPKDDSLLGGNLLDKPSVERSLSWGNLTQLSLADPQRSLSASNLYALNNPDLSIKAAISKKAYDKPHTSFSKEKAIFTAWTQKYYYQLTVGCGNDKCCNVFCQSSPQRKKFDTKMISLISIELAGYKNHHLCVKDKKRQAARVLDPYIFKPVDENSMQADNVPFLYRFYSMSPFRSLFLPCPLTPSGLGLHKTHSQGELSTPSKAKSNDHQNSPERDCHYADSFKSHLTSLTNTISNSVSNIFLYASQSDISEVSITNDEKYHQQRKSLDEKMVTQRKYKNEESMAVSGERKRIPSVRVFGEEYAVDTSSHSDNIDDFEMSVAAEFQQKDKTDCSSAKDVLLSEDDEDAFDDENGDNDNEEGELSDGYSLTHLTLDMFQNIVQNYLDCGDETFLLNTIRTVFASWDSLMMSFQHEGIPTEKRFLFNVKMVDVVEAFNLLQKVDKNEKFLIILADTLQVMLLKKQSIREGKELKPLVLMLAIPYLFKYVDVVHEISSMISGLSHNSLLALSQFIGECFKPDQFEYLVQVKIILYF